MNQPKEIKVGPATRRQSFEWKPGWKEKLLDVRASREKIEEEAESAAARLYKEFK